MRLRDALIAASVLGLGLAAVPAASAVVPTAPAILKRVAPTYARVPAGQALVVTAREVSPDGPGTRVLRITVTGAEVHAETLDYATGEVSTRTLPLSKVADGTPGPSDADAWLLWLAGVPGDGLLTRLGIDRGRTSLGLRAREVLWVIGAGPREASRPQVQLERGTGRLRRVVHQGGAVQLDGVAAAEGPGAAWPGRITLEAGPAPATSGGGAGGARTFEVTEVRLVTAEPPPPVEPQERPGASAP